LVAEDDADLREILHDILVEEGYSVTLASSLAEALAYIDAGTFALVLTDLFDKPFNDPLASARVIQQRAYPTPVAVMTAWALGQEVIEGANLAAVISKPFDFQDLLSSIASAVQRPGTPNFGAP